MSTLNEGEHEELRVWLSQLIVTWRSQLLEDIYTGDIKFKDVPTIRK